MIRPSFNAALIIPTGVGASIGGYGGDGMTLLPLFASVCDTVITHPNVANAACFQTLPQNVWYVEGYALDRFFAGDWPLVPVRQNRIGIIWDAGVETDMETLHRNTIDAVKTVYGVDVVGVTPTREPVDITIDIQASGRSAGRVTNPEVLLEGGQTLIAQGATALAVCCLMPEVADAPENQSYQSGQGVDPIGGIEAMISHLLVSEFQLPSAHAPVFPYEEALPVTDRRLDPRAASEFIVSTFLPCVLTGLSRAPQYQVRHNTQPRLQIEDVSALVVPGNALGSLPVLAAARRSLPILAVENNTTVMACPPDALGLENTVIPCSTYQEALGHLVALKQGITLPKHFYPHAHYPVDPKVKPVLEALAD